MGLLRRSMELGLGAMILTKEAAEELFDELSSDAAGSDPQERRRLVDELVEKGQKLRAELTQTIRAEVDHAIERSGLVRRSDYEALAARVEALERGTQAPVAIDDAPEIESASDL